MKIKFNFKNSDLENNKYRDIFENMILNLY